MPDQVEMLPTDGDEPLSYEGTPIRMRGQMLNLTDMWRAAATSDDRRPWKWLQQPDTRRFSTFLRSRHGQNTPDRRILDAPETSEDDWLVVAERGRTGATWAHWRLALSYARYLSPAFHLWCNKVVRKALLRGKPSRRGFDHVTDFVAGSFEGAVLKRLERLDRNDADLMFLVTAMRQMLIGERAEYTQRTREIMCEVISTEDYDGKCPACRRTDVIDADKRPIQGAEYDHFFSAKLNKPDSGWLICRQCHLELTHGSYLARTSRLFQFREFQEHVLDELKRRKGEEPAPS